MLRLFISFLIFSFLLVSLPSHSQGVYGVFSLPPGTNFGEKQIGTVSPTTGTIGLLGTNTSVETGALTMTTGATALNVTLNKSYFIANDLSNNDRIYTVDLTTGITDSNPTLTAGYTTSNNWGVWYDEPNSILYGLFHRVGFDIEIVVINPTTGAITSHHSTAALDGTALGSGLLTGNSVGEQIYFLGDGFLYVISTSSTDTGHSFDIAGEIQPNLNTSNVYGMEWDTSTDGLWVLFHEDLGNRKLMQIKEEDGFMDAGEPFQENSITLDNDASITTASGLSAIDVQSSSFFFIGRPSVNYNGATNDNKWSLYTVDLLGQDNTSVDIENTLLVQTNGYAGIEVLPGPNLSFSKTDGGITSTPGSTITYTLNYSNAVGSGATSGLKITETVPAETTFVPGSSTVGWVCSPVSGVAGSICEISPAQIAPGGNGSATFSVQVDAYVTAGLSQISNSATLSATNASDPVIANDTTDITAAAVLAVTKTDNGATSTPGGTITYQISASNTGNRITANALLTETVPVNTVLNSGLSTGWSCAPDNNAGATCTNTVGSLAGTAFDTAFAVDVIPSVPAGTTAISNSVTFSADGVASAQASDTTPITSSAVLTLSKNDGGGSLTPGNSVTYQLDYANTGDQDADTTTIVETILAETTYDASNSTAGWVCVPDTNPTSVCTFTLGTLGGGTNGSIDFALQLNNPVSDTLTQLDNTATIDASNASSVDAQDTTPIIATVSLRMEKTDGNVTAALEKIISYTLRYFNDGDRNAVNVVLTETVPDNTTFYPLSSTPIWTCAPDNSAGSTCTYPIGGLTGGTNDSVFFAVKVDASLDVSVTELSNTASVNASNAPSSANDTELTPVDRIAPTVTSVDANPTISGINQCSQNMEAIDQLLVSFHDDNSGLVGTDTSSNYLLIDTGNDQDLQTTNCLGATGDDVVVTINSLIPGGTASDPTALLDLGTALDDGHYSLLVCDTISDAAGNLLDGNSDGTQGGNLSNVFRIEQDNIFDNAYFDDCSDAPVSLPPWQGTVATPVPFIDFDDSIISGSVLLTSSGGNSASVEQCVGLMGDSYYSFDSSFLESLNPLHNSAEIVMSCVYSDLANCASVIDSQFDSHQLVSSTNPIWKTFSSTFLSPSSAVSANCKVSLFTSTDGGFAAYADEISLIEIAQGPIMSISKSDGDISTLPGGMVTYTFDYSTTVGSPATVGLKLTETVPAETSFLPASSTVGWNCIPDNTAGSICELAPAELTSGGSDSATFTVQVNDYVSPLVIELNNTVIITATNAINSATDSDVTPIASAVAILAVTKTDNDVLNTVPGDSITYQIVASNTGNREVTNTVLTETVSANTVFNSGLSIGWSCLPDETAGSICINEIGELAGTPFNTDFVVDVVSSVSSGTLQIDNTVILSADAVIPLMASDSTPVTSAAILTLDKDDGGGSLSPGNSVIYQLDYANIGNQDAASTTIMETVLPETTFDASKSTAGWICSPDTNPGSSCNLIIGTLGGGTNGSANFALKLNNPVSDTITQLNNSAVVDASNASFVEALDTTPIDAAVSLRMVKTDGGVAAGLDNIVGYTLIYFNNGNRNAVDGIVTETVPDNTTFYPMSSSPQWSCAPDNTAGSVCTINHGDILGGQKSSALFSVKVNSTVLGGITSISNTASVDASNAPSPASDTELTPLDGVVPVVTLVDAIPSISEISQCSQNDAMINQLLVAFDENDDGLTGVDNLNNYRLIDTGMDQDLQSSECGILLGDDVQMSFNGLVVGGSNNNPTASLDIGMTLKDGVYALMVCDDITDSIGNQLDGDGNGTQGGNLIRNFRVEQGNLFDNAFLDNCVDAPIMLPPWMTVGGDVTADIDSNDSSLSGAIELMSIDGSEVSASQCVDVSADKYYVLEASVLGTAVQTGDIDISLTCDFSDVVGCGSITETHAESFALAASVTPTWHGFVSIMITPMNAVSANCAVSLSSPSNNEFVNYLDEFDYRNSDLIFENGFELMVD